MAVTRVGLGRGGIAVTRKWARPEHAARLRHEAAVLERLRHPGAVELVALVEHGDGSVEMTTAYVGPNSLAELGERGVLTGEQLARFAAEAAATLADAHDRAIAHGSVSADHVLAGPGDRAVLCSWGEADASPSGDVAALGAVIMELLRADPQDAVARGLAAIAANATAADPAARPTMRGMAAALRALLPVEWASPTAPVPAVRSVRKLALAAACAGTTVLAVVAATGVVSAGSEQGQRPGPDPVPTTTTTTTTTAGPVVPERVWPRPAAHELTSDGQRYALGEPGDLVAVGDWDCDGDATPALVRVGHGTIYAFDAWPEPGSEVAGRLAGRVPDPRSVRAVDTDGDGCDELEITPDTDTRVVLRLN